MNNEHEYTQDSPLQNDKFEPVVIIEKDGQETQTSLKDYIKHKQGNPQ